MSTFDDWMGTLSDFQRRRSLGTLSDPWGELNSLEGRVDGIAVAGLDLREAARCMLLCERAAIFAEQRDFAKALEVINGAVPNCTIPSFLDELITANAELLRGNVDLFKDGDAAKAEGHYRKAVSYGDSHSIPFIRGNAAYNLGVCLNLLDQNEEAIEAFEKAEAFYQLAGKSEKQGEVLHAIGNSYRNLGRLDDGIRHLHAALDFYRKHENPMSIWMTADDLCRCYLRKAFLEPEKRAAWIERADDVAAISMYFLNEIWDAQKNSIGRLAHLSDQMLNHTSTCCELAMNRDDAPSVVACLARNKGRIRSTIEDFPASILNEVPPELGDGLRSQIPGAYLKLVEYCLEQLRPAEGSIALIDYFVIQGGFLVIGIVVVTPNETFVDALVSNPLEPQAYDGGVDFRGRGRLGKSGEIVANTIGEIERHGKRCSFLLPEDVWHLDAHASDQLDAWALELKPHLSRLGEWFFPQELIEMLEELKVVHAVLCIDPAFSKVPYAALQCGGKSMVEYPWTLSTITASTEIVRILDRSRRCEISGDLNWFAPDKRVNEELGGNSELAVLEGLFSSKTWIEGAATVSEVTRTMEHGCWIHFRGHGCWTGDVTQSGPVFWNNEILSSDRYPKSSNGSFLFTAACRTVFGEPVGSELVGSLVDYDYSGLSGAVLTNWPIHGNAATVFSKHFYSGLAATGSVAKAMKRAWLESRTHFPHPYLWASFSLVGTWATKIRLTAAGVQ